jgi:hypothetical protein
MPLADPISATPTSNYPELALAVSFATSTPGENVADFQSRIRSRGEWGQSEVGRHRGELVFTRESARRLVEMLEQVVGGELG